MTKSADNPLPESFAEGSVSQYLAQAKDGDERAAAELWNRYFERLVAIARRKLSRGPTRAANEEDAAASAFGSLFRGIEANRFKRLDDRDDLWPVLVMLTVRKAVNQRERERAQKRGGGLVRGESAFGGVASHEDFTAGLAKVVGEEPTPDFLAEMEEQCQVLLDRLDDELRQLVLWRLEGHSNREIAKRTGHVISWVERKFRIIRRKWSRAVDFESKT